MKEHKIADISALETHDRYKYFTKQDFDIGKTCQDIINTKPFGDYPFYIFAHKRTVGMDEKYDLWNSGSYKALEDLPSARLIWQPRLTKPKAQENSMLFKADPKTDVIQIIWMIPDSALWPSYESGKLTGNETIATSIYDFQHNRGKLEMKDPDDLPDERIDEIYKQLAYLAREKACKARSIRRPKESVRENVEIANV